MSMNLVLSAFTSSPISLLPTNKADVYHLISSYSGLPEPSLWYTLKHCWKAMAIKHLLLSFLVGNMSHKCLPTQTLL